MTIASQTSRISYTGDGVTTGFAVPFYFQVNTDLVVYLTDLGGNAVLQVLGTNYNLTGATVSSGGTCTFTTAPASGYLLAIYRDPALTQTTSYNNNDPFPAKSHELALDKALTIDQRTRDIVSRSMHLNDADPAAPMTLPTLPIRKGKILGFSAIDGSAVASNNTLATLDSVLSGALATSGGFNRIVLTASNATLKAMTPFAGAVVYQQGYAADNDGGQGIFVWNASSTATPDNGLVVQPNAGGVGRWLRTTSLTPTSVSPYGNGVRTINLGDLGAGNGSQAVDDAALAAAVTYANSASGKVAIVWPNGTFTHGPCAVTLTKADVSFYGSGSTTINLVLTSGQIFLKLGSKVSGVANNVVVSNLSFNCASCVFPSTMFALENTFHVRFYDLNLSLAQTFLSIGTVGDSATGVNGVKLSRIFGSSANGGAPLIKLNYGAGLFMHDCYLFLIITPPTHGGAAQTTTAGTHVFSMVSSNWDTASISNCVFQFFDIGFQVVVRGAGVVENFHITNSYIANCKHEAILFDVTSGGVAQGFCVSNSWLESWEADTVKFGNAGGFMDDNCFGSNTFANAGLSHANITGSSKSNKLINNRMICCNQTSAGSNSINMAGGATGWTISGNTGNYDDSGSTGSWRGPIGIFVGADCDDYIITGNRMLGSTNSYVITANTTGSKQRRVFNNSNADFTTYGGYARVAAVSLTANAYLNKTPFVQDVMILGGTVTDITLAGTTITNATSGSFRVEPGETISCSNSVLPAVTARTMA